MQAVADNLTGRTLGDRYELRHVTAQEHLGKVYAAWDHRRGGPVHVKVLEPAFVDDPRKFARFGREITASFLVSHPNTVEVLDWGQHDALHWLVLEPLDARPLADEIADGPVDPARAARILAQVASAIGAAHQEGIVHRALTPRSVAIVTGSDPVVAKVRDFGMAKLESTVEGGHTQTTVSTRVEDLAYFAPEYVETGHYLKKSDLYALGALGWHLLTGRAPPAGAIVPNAAIPPVPPPSKVVSGVPGWLDALVMELLEADPNRRPGAWRVVRRVEAALGEPVDRREAERATAPAPPAEERPSGIAVVGGIAVIVAALLVGAAVIVVAGVALIVAAWMAT